MIKLNSTKKGIITGTAMILLSVILFYGMHLADNGANQYFVWLVYVAGITWSLFDFKRKQTDAVGFKDYFSEGFKTFIVAVFFMAVFTFVFYKFNPQVLENAIKLNNAILAKEGNHTTAEIDQNAIQLRKIFLPAMITSKITMYLFIGAFVTCITSFIIRPREKENASLEATQN